MASAPNHASLATAGVPVHQRLVDEHQARIRAEMQSGPRSLFNPPPPRPGRSGDVLDERISEELDLVVRQLEHLGDVLASDPLLLQRHAIQMQSIDLMQQVLCHLSRIVAADDKSMAVEHVTLTELKGRLRRTALRSVAN
jgi:hypothetical protein